MEFAVTVTLTREERAMVEQAALAARVPWAMEETRPEEPQEEALSGLARFFRSGGGSHEPQPVRAIHEARRMLSRIREACLWQAHYWEEEAQAEKAPAHLGAAPVPAGAGPAGSAGGVALIADHATTFRMLAETRRHQAEEVLAALRLMDRVLKEMVPLTAVAARMGDRLPEEEYA